MARSTTTARRRTSSALPHDEIAALAESLQVYRFFPVEFTRHVIGVELDPWQQWTARAIAKTPRVLAGMDEPTLDMRRVAVASSTGVGKDMLAACLGLWFLTTFPNPKVIATGPSDDQLDDVLWPEFAKWIMHSAILPLLVEWQAEAIIHRGNPTNAFISRRTANVKVNRGEKRATGMAGVHEENVLVIGDEAPGIPDEVFDAMLPTLTDPNNLIFLIGNPEITTGLFYRIWYDSIEAEMWQKIRVSSDPWPTRFRGKPDFVSDRPSELSKMMLRRKPDSDPYKQAKLWGRHPIETATNVAYSHDELMEAFARPAWPMSKEDPCQIGVDCARFGNDRSVFVIRRGWNVTRFRIEGQTKETTIAAIVKELCEEEGAITYWLHNGGDFDDARHEFADLPQIDRARFYPLVVLDLGGGYGAGPYDILTDDGYTNVEGVHFGSTAWADDEFADLASEMWCDTLKEYMRMLSFALVKKQPDGPSILDDIRMQLTKRPFDFNRKDDRKKILSKRELKALGIMQSPDEADGLCLCVVKPPSVGAM